MTDADSAPKIHVHSRELSTSAYSAGGSNRDMEVLSLGNPCIMLSFRGLSDEQDRGIREQLYHTYACGIAEGVVGGAVGHSYDTYVSVNDAAKVKKVLETLESQGAVLEAGAPEQTIAAASLAERIEQKMLQAQQNWPQTRQGVARGF